jgi:stearoyl-CoA desaturase (delta-9 desaturase)
VMHRMHHAYSDTPRDPHSPVHQRNFFGMMWRTLRQYDDLRLRRVVPEARFDGGYPEWKLFDETLAGWGTSFAWGVVYTLYYVAFATHWWMFLLLPFHWLMGPTHGAIVNWFGHKLGYRNYDSDDNSKNTLVFDVLTMGELFQNNHHKWGQSPNFAVRWFEIDPTFQFVRLLGWLRIIDLSGAQVARWVPKHVPAAIAAAPSPMDAE